MAFRALRLRTREPEGDSETNRAETQWPFIGKLVLASNSNYSRQYLSEVCSQEFDIVVPEVGESAYNASNSRVLALSLAYEKAQALVGNNAVDLVPNNLGRTLVICEGVVLKRNQELVLHKPRTRSEAVKLVNECVNATTSVVNALVIVDVEKQESWHGFAEAQVTFPKMPAQVVEEIARIGLEMKCAGGICFTNQLVQSELQVQMGDLSTMVGFSKPLLTNLLNAISSETSGHSLFPDPIFSRPK